MSYAVTLTGEQFTYRLELPFPVSANRLWRATTVRHTRRGSVLGYCAPRMHLSPQYQSWIKEADGLYLMQKRRIGPMCMLGTYRLACVFAREKRNPIADGDNLTKCLHDWLQRTQIIKNDCLCDGASWTWGEAPAGTSLVVTGYPWNAGEA